MVEYIGNDCFHPIENEKAKKIIFNSYYFSSIGRFLKPDNLIPNAFNPQSWNLYTYVNGNPVNFNDPTGHYGAFAGRSPKPVYMFQMSGADWVNWGAMSNFYNSLYGGNIVLGGGSVGGGGSQSGYWKPIYGQTVETSSDVVWDPVLSAYVGGEMIVTSVVVGVQWVEVGGGMVSNPENEKGYIDFNFSFAFEVPVGITSGIMINGAFTHFYFGAGVIGPPGPSCSLTWSENEISEGWNTAIQFQGGIAYQKGISQNLDTFTEKGVGFPYGISITTFYVSPPLPQPPPPTPANRKFYLPW